ncbi:MAG: GNAT family [Lasallia pustulata]|uniref:GNAT family n=1 Tax=Lasallia pustulata TaxID=136370 RepID=A0A5M8PRU1_9LECA|nr:MAG: GNAT family [Lasallia pustulata]
MSIRERIFVHTQSVPLENELDADDPRSWHWVAYASVGAPKANRSSSSSSSSGGEQRRPSESGRVPVGTLRLVPPPHPPHPQPEGRYAVDNSGDAAPGAERAANRKSAWHDGKEAYVKLGRLATLQEYRGLGLGRLLVNTALEWVRRNAEAVSVGGGDAVERERGGVEERWRGLVLVHAQVGVVGFWRGLGFVVDEGLGEWWEEGIRHVGMWRRLEVKEGR